MSREIKKSLVPKLRFPEFRDAGEWKINNLGKYVYLQNGFAFKSSKFVSDGIPIIRISNISSGSIILEDVVYYPSNEKIPSEFLIKDGDALIAMSGATTGKVGMYRGDRSIFQNQRVGKFVPKSVTKVSKAYIFHLVNSDLFRVKLRAELEQGAQPNISSRQIENFEFPFSLYFEEQKAIADCLSSVDELITAQTQKIDALKAHKKGLMQKLFPAEGETLPKLRFPKFRDAGEWEEMRLGDVAQLYNNPWKVGDENLPYIALKHIQENEFRITNTGNSDEVASNKNRFTSNHFLFGKLRPYLRKLYRPDFDGICSTDIWVVEPKMGNDKDFLFYFFANQAFIDSSCSEATGTRMPRADWNFIKETKWNIPPLPEQKAIADCLSPIDKLITAQTQKIDALKAHKKGLMQKLFPSP